MESRSENPRNESIESICQRFRYEWQSGAEPDIESFLQTSRKSNRDQLFRKLLSIDIEFRISNRLEQYKDSKSIKSDETLIGFYESRFPERESEIREVLSQVLSGDEFSGDHFQSSSEKRGETPCDQLEDTRLANQDDAELSIADDTFFAKLIGSKNEHFPVIPGFKISRKLGTGGMGVVYLAKQEALGRWVAVKVLKYSAANTDARRLESEAMAAARLEHPNIVQVFESGRADDIQYFVMAYVDGVPLSRMISEQVLDENSQILILKKVAEAIHYAHQNGVIHRDLKPSNIIIDQSGEPKVADFGLAKLLDSDFDMTMTGAALGTPAFMPPEQAAGQSHRVEPASDVYSIGAILYQMLVGRPPFRASSVVETLKKVVHEDPELPSRLAPEVKEDLQTVCMKCLEKDPRRRYATAKELAEELGRFLEHRPILARPISRLERFTRLCKRNPKTCAALAAIFASLLAGILTSAFFALQANERAAIANENLDRAETLLYEATIPTAQRWIDEGLNSVAKDILAEVKPELAGWEYSYLENTAKQLVFESPGVNFSISANGKTLLIGNGKTLDVWSLTTDQKVKTLELDEYSHRLKLSADGKQLYVNTSKEFFGPSTLRVIDVESGETSMKNEDQLVEARQLLLSPDGSRLGILEPNRLIRFDPKTLRVIGEVLNFANPVSGICFLSDNKECAIAIGQEVKTLDWETGEMSEAKYSHGSEIKGLRFEPNSRQLLSFDKNNVVVWSLETDELVTDRLRTGAEIFDVTFMDNGRRIACGLANRLIAIWEVEAGQIVGEIRGHSNVVIAVAASSDNKRLVSAEPQQVDSRVGIKVWDVDLILQRQLVFSGMPGHSVRGIAVAPNSQFVAVSSSGGGEMINGQPVKNNPVVEIRKINDNSLIKRIQVRGEYAPNELWISPDNDSVRWHDDAHLLVEYQFETGTTTRNIPIEPGYRTVGYSLSGRFAVESQGNVRMAVWNCERLEKIVDVPITGIEVVGGYTFSPDESVLYCGMLDGTIWIVDLASGAILKEKLFDGFVNANAVNSNGTEMTVASGRIIRIYSLPDFKLKREIVGHGNVIRCLGYSFDGRRLVSGATDSTVRLWNVESGRELLRFNEFLDGVVDVEFGPNRDKIIATGFDNVRLYSKEPLLSK